MDEHDDFRRIAYERDDLICALRRLGAVDLDVVRGVGFDAKPKVIRRAHDGGGSGQYIGSPYEVEMHWDQSRIRRH